MKPKLKFVGLERAKMALDDLQKEGFDTKAHVPLPLKQENTSVKESYLKKRKVLNGVNLPSAMDYFKYLSKKKKEPLQR
eukprot:14394968-Ditylum_brightwellii.AAC.1